MTFAAPLFLLAALAAAIPIVLHMVNRRRAKQLPFSTLRFLKISVEKTRRRKRIHDVLLMLLRAAVLLLIAAGLARPTVTTFGALWGNAGTAAVIVLDNSASMGTIDGDRPRFETRRRRGRPNPRSTWPKATRWRCCRRAVRRFPTPASSTARRTPFVRCSASAASATSEPTWR